MDNFSFFGGARLLCWHFAPCSCWKILNRTWVCKFDAKQGSFVGLLQEVALVGSVRDVVEKATMFRGLYAELYINLNHPGVMGLLCHERSADHQFFCWKLFCILLNDIFFPFL